MEPQVSSRCDICGDVYPVEAGEAGYYCPVCLDCYPPALIKATCDPFDYAVKVRDIGVLEFEHASIHGEWATIYPHGGTFNRPFHDQRYGHELQSLPYNMDRGLEIRVNDIIWIADAPNGS